MSIELKILLWLPPERPASERIERVRAAVEDWAPLVDEWQPGRSRPGPPALESTGRAARMWRFSGGAPVDGFVRLGLDAWDDGHPTHPVLALDGHASAWFPEAGPWVAAQQPGHEAANTLVEENLERLTELLFLLIDRLQPTRLAVHTGAGFHHALNAHALWVPDRSLLLAEDAHLRQLWREGAPAWRLPPLSDPATPDSPDTLHEWRSPDQRASAWGALAQLVAAPPPDPAALERVLTSGRFDFYERGDGLLLLEYPHTLNAFLDRFFFALAGVGGG